MKSKLKIPLILASTSPRRIYLMSQVLMNIEIQTPRSQEIVRRGEKPARLVTRLSEEKATSVREIAIQRHETSLIVAADTIVVTPNEGKILGKPQDSADAQQMLKKLAGRTHSVLTGYCILLVNREKKDKKVSRVVTSRVKIRPLSDKMIANYVASGESMDKAGAYAAQGLGMTLIDRIDGSYTNVVGLPIAQVFIDLEKEFKLELFSWIPNVHQKQL